MLIKFLAKWVSVGIIEPWVNFSLTDAPSEVPGSSPVLGNADAHFYCGTSSDNLFWIPHSLKHLKSESEFGSLYIAGMNNT